jgi:hypothetical protein
MHSTALDVLTYLQHVPTDRVACLTTLRQLCLDTLTDYEEAVNDLPIQWGGLRE